jgi:pyruvate,water dikinase
LSAVYTANLRGLDTRDIAGLAERGRKVRDGILASSIPADLQQALVEAYGKLCQEYGPDTDTAVRSSATAEDLARHEERFPEALKSVAT